MKEWSDDPQFHSDVFLYLREFRHIWNMRVHHLTILSLIVNEYSLPQLHPCPYLCPYCLPSGEKFQRSYKLKNSECRMRRRSVSYIHSLTRFQPLRVVTKEGIPPYPLVPCTHVIPVRTFCDWLTWRLYGRDNHVDRHSECRGCSRIVMATRRSWRPRGLMPEEQALDQVCFIC